MTGDAGGADAKKVRNARTHADKAGAEKAEAGIVMSFATCVESWDRAGILSGPG
jgi:hypothetical protein